MTPFVTLMPCVMSLFLNYLGTWGKASRSIVVAFPPLDGFGIVNPTIRSILSNHYPFLIYWMGFPFFIDFFYIK